MKTDHQKLPRNGLTITELLIVVAINSVLIAVLLPAVIAAREAQRRPPLWIEPFYEDHPWLVVVGASIVVTLSVVAAIGLLQYLLPEASREGISSWAAPKSPTPPLEPIADSRPAFVASALALAGAAILLFVATHVREDRTNRSPVVTWEGPLADYIRPATTVGLALSVAAFIVGMLAISGFRSKWNFLAGLATCLGTINIVGSFLFNVLVYED